MSRKPPLGIRPQWAMGDNPDEFGRIIELKSAIIRRLSENMQIPDDWVYEYNNRIKVMEQ